MPATTGARENTGRAPQEPNIKGSGREPAAACRELTAGSRWGPEAIQHRARIGTGKTHLATAQGHIAVRRRYSMLMARADKLFKRLKAARLDNTVEAEMRRPAHV